jgi:glutamyl/glutaminyl-tRNA synthetase
MCAADLKALVINFGFAKFHNGHCYLRYDDTNPEAEEQIYIDAILDAVHWLGFEPFQITYASDHFQRLFDCAKELIRRGLAYVDHSTGSSFSLLPKLLKYDRRRDEGAAGRRRPQGAAYTLPLA